MRASLRYWFGSLVGSACALLLMSVATMPARADQPVSVVRAGRVLLPDGSLKNDGVVVIRDGKILQVGGKPPTGAPVAEFGDGAVISPGLIDIASTLGARGADREIATPIEPEAGAADLIDATATELRGALAGGVTLFAVAPGRGNLIGGRVAICRTFGDSLGDMLIDAPAAPLQVSLDPEVLADARQPTSRSAAVAMLRQALRTARDSDDAPAVLREVAKGERAALAFAPSGADILSLADLVDEPTPKWILVHSADARDVVAYLPDSIVGVVIGPFGFETPQRWASAGADFEQAGATVAIAGGLPNGGPNGLRISAAVATRAGMSPIAARRALSTTPAELLGVERRFGSIERGRDADIVVWSGDPLDLTSRVLAVFVAGQRIAVVEPMAAAN